MDEEFADLAADFEAIEGRTLQEPQNYTEGKQIIAYLRFRNGSQDAHDEAQLNTSSGIGPREKILAKNTRKVLGSYIKFVLSQRYNFPYLFLEALIQNADDARYSRAQADMEAPTIKFRFTNTELVVDLNEDGFTLNDVIAICSAGKSSDSRPRGVKGFGFKSVFSIASKVHIQSGLWSFVLHHQRHEDGAGMVSPSWYEPTELPAGIRTRFRLTYDFQRDGSFEELRTYVKKQTAFLLKSLRKIRRIEFNFQHEPGYYEDIILQASCLSEDACEDSY